MLAYSHDVALADEIVAEIIARTDWALQFDCRRTWVPEWTLRGGELDRIQVSINPSILASGELGERSQIFGEWAVDVTISQKLSQRTMAEVDGLAHLVEQLRRFLCPQSFTLSDGREFHSLAFEYLARFDPHSMQQARKEGGVLLSGIFKSAFSVGFLLCEVAAAPTEEN